MTVDEYLERIEGLAEIARAEAPDADRARRLGDKTVQAIVDAGLHRALLPPALGGGGITWAENFRLIEALARVDGAASWNTSIWAGTAQLAVTLADEDASAEVLGDGSSLCSASLNWLNLSARRVDGGYVIDGKATFLSGSSHAQWLSLGGWLYMKAFLPLASSYNASLLYAIANLALLFALLAYLHRRRLYLTV